MTTPAEVRFELERKLLSLAQGDMVPLIMGIHSVVVEGNTVHVGYDIVPPPPNADLLDFDFERPAVVGRDEVRDFAHWLAWSDYGETVH
jgi:hypothetical protein